MDHQQDKNNSEVKEGQWKNTKPNTFRHGPDNLEGNLTVTELLCLPFGKVLQILFNASQNTSQNTTQDTNNYQPRPYMGKNFKGNGDTENRDKSRDRDGNNNNGGFNKAPYDRQSNYKKDFHQRDKDDNHQKSENDYMKFKDRSPQAQTDRRQSYKGRDDRSNNGGDDRNDRNNYKGRDDRTHHKNRDNGDYQKGNEGSRQKGDFRSNNNENNRNSGSNVRKTWSPAKTTYESIMAKPLTLDWGQAVDTSINQSFGPKI